MPITCRRPMRSDMRPPITDDAVLTTWIADQSSGIQNGAMPTSRETQQQERVAGITEAEEEDERHRMPESARQALARSPDVGTACSLGVGSRALEVDDCFAPRVGDTQQDQDDDDARHDRQREERAVVVRAEIEKRRGEERAHDRPGVIHAAMETEDLPAVGFGRRTSPASRRAARSGCPCPAGRRTAAPGPAAIRLPWRRTAARSTRARSRRAPAVSGRPCDPPSGPRRS